ncbi:hypothetical protein GCM10009001_25530 [Virgibacillus siamensis]|uniref:TRAP-type C4-dicarboxylate transport system, small permease component n=1 Tax=Virgibacillus siamensis TaxID=480071 RepID=A0ABP3RCN3_9BACI
MGFFRKNNMKDERVINLQNKIYRELYILVLVICMISAIIKIFLYGMGTDAIYTEMIILLAQGVYYAFRSAGMGIFSDEVEMHDRTSKMPMEKKMLIKGLIFGVAIALFFGTRSAILYGENTGNPIYTFFLVMFVSLIIYVPFFVLVLVISHTAMKKKSDKAVEKQLDDMDEDGDSDEKH